MTACRKVKTGQNYTNCEVSKHVREVNGNSNAKKEKKKKRKEHEKRQIKRRKTKIGYRRVFLSANAANVASIIVQYPD